MCILVYLSSVARTRSPPHHPLSLVVSTRTHTRTIPRHMGTPDTTQHDVVVRTCTYTYDVVYGMCTGIYATATDVLTATETAWE